MIVTPYHPEFIEGLSKGYRRHQFACQYFDKLNMTSKLTFETAFFLYETGV